METKEIVCLCLVVLCAVVFGVMLYFKVKGNVLGAVSELIAQWEATGLTGAEKMYQVVGALYELVPVPLRKIFTKERLESIAQHIFDWMRKYADEYLAKLERLAQEGQSDAETANPGWEEVAVQIIAELVGMPLSGLKEKATEYGICADGLTTKKDFVAAIVLVMLLGHGKTE